MFILYHFIEIHSVLITCHLIFFDFPSNHIISKYLIFTSLIVLAFSIMFNCSDGCLCLVSNFDGNVAGVW